MTRTLITGANGFVGANLARRLLANGHEVHALLRPGRARWRLNGVIRAIQTHEVDLADYEPVAEVIAAVQPQWVFHLAAYGAYSHQIGLHRMVETNLLATANLVDASAKAGVVTFIQTGSSSEYGYSNHPTSEDECLHPNSHYALTKAAATHYSALVAKQADFNAITVRLYSIYGPYEDPGRLIPALLLHGMSGGFPPLVSPQTARDFVYVDDAVDAILQVAKATGVRRGSVYNVCSGVQTTLAEVIEIAVRLLKVPGTPVWSTMQARGWDTDKWVGSPTRMAQDIGWKTKISLESGLQQTIEWLHRHPEVMSFYSKQILTKNA